MARPPDPPIDDLDRPSPNRRAESSLARLGPTTPRPRGWRAYATRQAVTDAVKTLTWLVPLTVLIWVYAEREQTIHTPYPIGVAVRVTTNVADRFVELAGGAKTQTINLKLSGPQNGVDEVKQALAATGLTIDLGSRRGPGPGQPVSVVDAIQNLTVFKTSGVSVDEAQPAEVYVNVDDVTDREAVVEVDPKQRSAFVATFDPPHVTLHGPRGQLDALEANGKLRVYADPAKLEDAATGKGPLKVDAVPIVLPVVEDQVRVLQPTVSAKLQVRAENETVEIQSVPVLVTASPDTLRQYDVVLTELTLGNVHVTGPPDQIAALRAAGNVRAEVYLEPSDANSRDPKRVRYVNLPDGVAPVPEDADRTVEYKMDRRGQPGGG